MLDWAPKVICPWHCSALCEIRRGCCELDLQDPIAACTRPEAPHQIALEITFSCEVDSPCPAASAAAALRTSIHDSIGRLRKEFAAVQRQQAARELAANRAVIEAAHSAEQSELAGRPALPIRQMALPGVAGGTERPPEMLPLRVGHSRLFCLHHKQSLASAENAVLAAALSGDFDTHCKLWMRGCPMKHFRLPMTHAGCRCRAASA